MDEHTANQLLLTVGNLEGKIDSMQLKQTEMCKEIGGIRKEITGVRREITGVKVKAASFGTILGGIAGYFTKLIQ